MQPSYPEPIQHRIDLLQAAAKRADANLNAARAREHNLLLEIERLSVRFTNAKRANRGLPTLGGTLASASNEEVQEAAEALKGPEDELAEVRKQIGGLTSGLSKFDPNGLTAIAGNARALLDSVEKFLAYLPAGDELIAAYAPVGASDDVSEDGLAALRTRLSEAETERETVSRSVPPAEGERDLLRRWAAEKASTLEVEIGEGSRIGRSDTDARRRPIFTPSNPPTVTLLAATVPDALVEAIISAVDRTATEAGKLVLPPAERERRLAECDDEILALQRQEEAVITALATSGTFVPRRRKADPRAVLMVEVVERPAEVAVQAAE